MRDIPLTRRTTLALLLGLPLVARADEPQEPDLTGTWTWTYKDAEGVMHRHILEVEGRGKARSVQERQDNLEPVRVNDLNIKGREVYFTVLRGNRRSEYAGRLVDDDTINGQVLVRGEGAEMAEFGWTATRRPIR